MKMFSQAKLLLKVYWKYIFTHFFDTKYAEGTYYLGNMLEQCFFFLQFIIANNMHITKYAYYKYACVYVYIHKLYIHTVCVCVCVCVFCINLFKHNNFKLHICI